MVSQLRWFAYYCFQGNLQSVGAGGFPPPPPPPPFFFSRDRRVTILGGTFLGEVVYHLGDGTIWLHNDQTSTQNSGGTSTPLQPGMPSVDRSGSAYAEEKYKPGLLDWLTQWGNYGGEHWNNGQWIPKGGIGHGPRLAPTDWLDAWWERHDTWVDEGKFWATPVAKIGCLGEASIRTVFFWRNRQPYDQVTWKHWVWAWGFYRFGHD
jgi:hypothetical protein